MEGSIISVLISNSDGTEKSFKESHDGSLKSLMIALKNVKDKTNEYLTELVDEEKRNKSRRLDYAENTNAGDSDVEIEDDYIDSKIKKELLSELSDSSNANKSDKRTRSYKKNSKKARY